MIDDEDMDLTHNLIRYESCWSKTQSRFTHFSNSLPLAKLMAKMSFKFDKSTLSFFQSYRYLLQYQVVFFLVFLPLLWKQVGAYQGSLTETWQTFIPLVTLYSSFSPDLSLTYALTIFIFSVIALIGYMLKWSSFDKADTLTTYFKRQKYPLSSFNMEL